MVWWREEPHMTLRWSIALKSIKNWRNRNWTKLPLPGKLNSRWRTNQHMFPVMNDSEQEINLKLIPWLNKCSWDPSMAIKGLLETLTKSRSSQNHRWLLFHTFPIWAQVLLRAQYLMLSLNKFHKMRLKWPILKVKIRMNDEYSAIR